MIETIRAYAKTNLHLQVLQRRPDGLHEIISLMQVLTSLWDEIEIESGLSDSPSIEVKGIASPNSITKAFDAWSRAYGIKLSVKVKVTKLIPSPSGLGGPSSDAAALLLHLDRGYSHDSLQALISLGFSVGCDVPFFVSGAQAAIVQGAGESIMPIRPRRLRGRLLFPPWTKTSTRQAYERLDSLDRHKVLPVSEILNAYYSLEPEAWPFFNDFSLLYPMEDLKSKNAFLNGSGPSLLLLDKSLDLV
ncbi:MAG: hypothetical protein PHI83_01310 [Sphaerochaetaceae bacterium]|jgi:4-diphosphocytidyl-2-C-methyl-D-erythritol kinase|nr:hypothetical protein [Sphaerochaetaceae bacterium]